MAEKRGMKALELWCRRVTEGYPGVKVENMTTSWRDGLAFCALIHHFRPDLIDFDGLDKRDIYKNNELAFRIAERQLGIPALLDAEDMVEYEVPDRLSILTYLSQFYQAFVSNQQGANNTPARTHSAKVPDIISPTAKTAKTAKVGSGRLETCWSCRRPVFLAERLVAGGKLRHRTCFTCKRCGNQLNLVGCYETETGDFVCETCPDEEEKRESERKKQREGVEEENKGKSSVDSDAHPKQGITGTRNDEFGLNFEKELNLVRSKMKRKFLNDLVDDSSEARESAPPEIIAEDNLSSPFNDANDVQQSTAKVKALNAKIKTLLGEDFKETFSLLNYEPESFLADIVDIIDGVISDAVREVEYRVVEKSKSHIGARDSCEIREEKKKVDETVTTAIEIDTGSLGEEYGVRTDKIAIAKEEEKNKVESGKYDTEEKVEERTRGKEDDYPEDLNPFADDDGEEVPKISEKADKPTISPRKAPVPAARSKVPHRAGFNPAGQKIIEAPVVNLNPFWSDGEPSSDEDVNVPVPAPRASLRTPEEDFLFSRSQYGSFTSLNSLGSAVSRKKKGPAPHPPSQTSPLQQPLRSQYGSPAHRSPSPTASIRSHRKSKPAPPPPLSSSTVIRSDGKEILTDKREKNYENKLKQNLTVPDKSSYGKWKRKKGQAPGLPIPQRRRITPLPLEDFYRELEDLEIQQRELERQGVGIEQAIRMYEVESPDDSTEEESGSGKDVEDLVLQLFDIVNQKNELFRRQAELMYLRRQQRLEEEHADLEYQIRCLMGRSERNKTDSDKAREEELIRRLVEVVERRNEIIECLDMDRKREVEEDRSIHYHLEVFTGKKESSPPEVKSKVKSSPSFLKFVKKKKNKKEKSSRDKDRDPEDEKKKEVEGGDVTRFSLTATSAKHKKKWFLKP